MRATPERLAALVDESDGSIRWLADGAPSVRRRLTRTRHLRTRLDRSAAQQRMSPARLTGAAAARRARSPAAARHAGLRLVSRRPLVGCQHDGRRPAAALGSGVRERQGYSRQRQRGCRRSRFRRRRDDARLPDRATCARRPGAGEAHRHDALLAHLAVGALDDHGQVLWSALRPQRHAPCARRA